MVEWQGRVVRTARSSAKTAQPCRLEPVRPRLLQVFADDVSVGRTGNACIFSAKSTACSASQSNPNGRPSRPRRHCVIPDRTVCTVTFIHAYIFPSSQAETAAASSSSDVALRYPFQRPSRPRLIVKRISFVLHFERVEEAASACARSAEGAGLERVVNPERSGQPCDGRELDSPVLICLHSATGGTSCTLQNASREMLARLTSRPHRPPLLSPRLASPLAASRSVARALSLCPP